MPSASKFYLELLFHQMIGTVNPQKYNSVVQH